MKYLIYFLGLLSFGIISCSDKSVNESDDVSNEYKQYMREFVQGISNYAKGVKSNFFIIPQNG
jgi:hypothetical protein